MLSNVDLEIRLDASDLTERQKSLHLELSRAQRQAHEAGLGVLVLLEGWNYTGKPELVRFITERMDARTFKVFTWMPPLPGEPAHMLAQRYMEKMPRRGQIVFFVRSWYSLGLEARVKGSKGARLRWKDIQALEKSLADDGILIVKIWLHIGRAEMARRRGRERGALQWSPIVDQAQDRRFPDYLRAADKMLTSTHTSYAPWCILPATCPYYTQLAGAAHLLARLDATLQHPPPAPEPRGAWQLMGPPRLEQLDLQQLMPKARYLVELETLQARLARAQLRAFEAGRSVVMVFEGWDAAGKGGAIRRLRQSLNACYYEVHAIGAPEGEERRRHYLWRFWKRMPPPRQWGIFDRSWYGRLLVERVEGFAKLHEWQRAYDEINHFEDLLARSGAIILKFWLHISDEEQLRRFDERQNTEHKRYKMTDEDWRNRDKRLPYLEAAEEMFERTDRPHAPWILVPAECKRTARLLVMERLLYALEHS